jgi:hypothetical protein
MIFTVTEAEKSLPYRLLDKGYFLLYTLDAGM